MIGVASIVMIVPAENWSSKVRRDARIGATDQSGFRNSRRFEAKHNLLISFYCVALSRSSAREGSRGIFIEATLVRGHLTTQA